MDPKAGGTWLVAPNIRNASCSHPRYTTPLIYNVGIVDSIQALLILVLSLGILGANLLVIFVINHRRYTPYIQQQPRYLLTSLALNDFSIGLLITPFGVLPALFHCWPYGEIYCQIQALLRGALCQQSAVILVCMAFDRYMCAMHPDKYHQHSSKKGCVAILSVAWILCLTIFGMLVLPKGYYFNNTGLLVCEPFYSKPSYRILATCSLYFPTTMILMYCYGSSFHAKNLRALNNRSLAHAAASYPCEKFEHPQFQVFVQDPRLNGSASRTMASMSLGFIVMVTPWTIQEVVAACTGSKVPQFLDFLITWTAISSSFWNPFIYWMLNAHFRRISRELLFSRCCRSNNVTVDHKTRCCSVSSDCADPTTMLPLPPGPPSSHPPRSDPSEGMSEKYWGEILERTVSSNSLHALQRIYGQSPHRHAPHQQTPSSHHQQHQLPMHNHPSHRSPKSGSYHDMNGGTGSLMATTNGMTSVPKVVLSTGTPSCCCSVATTQTCTNCTSTPNGNHDGHENDDDVDDDEVIEDVQRLSNLPSNGEPQQPHMCEHFQHDRHCAKSQAFF